MFGIVGRIFTAIAIVGGLTGPRAHGGIISSNEIPFQQQISSELERNVELGSALYGFKGSIREAIPTKPVTDCMFVTSEARRFVVETVESSNTVCGIYIISEPDALIVVSFPHIDVPCESGNLMGVVDGWELNGQYFPPPADHSLPLNQRSREFCGQENDAIFFSSQNVALVQYKIPTVGKGFTVSIQFIKSYQPCNVLSISDTDPVTLRNEGRRINCTFTTIFPAVVRITALDVGSKTMRGKPLAERQTGILRKCKKRGARDEVQIGGSVGFDLSQFASGVKICGVDSNPSADSKIISCEVTSVRLVSSGKYDNSVTITARPAKPSEVDNADLICGANF